MMKAGIEIHEWQGHPDLVEFKSFKTCPQGSDYWPGRTLHTKAVIVDGEVALLGSSNLNVRSELLNSEVMALVRDPRFAQELEAVFDFDLDRSAGPRFMDCAGGGQVPGRPPRTVPVTKEYLRDQFHRRGVLLRFLHLFQAVM
jgi:hypothetical protein